MNEDRVSTAGLRQAERQLAALIDIAEEQEESVPSWMIAAHTAVREQMRRQKTGATAEVGSHEVY